MIVIFIVMINVYRDENDDNGFEGGEDGDECEWLYSIMMMIMVMIDADKTSVYVDDDDCLLVEKEGV